MATQISRSFAYRACLGHYGEKTKQLIASSADAASASARITDCLRHITSKGNQPSPRTDREEQKSMYGIGGDQLIRKDCLDFV